MPDAQEVAARSTAALMAEDAASAMLGMQVLACGPGTSQVSMRVRADMVNGWGTCHGGIIAALADTAFAVACNSGGRLTVAAGFDVDFLEPGREGDLLVASGRQTSVRGRSGVYDVTVVREADGVAIAEFRGRSRTRGETFPMS